MRFLVSALLGAAMIFGLSLKAQSALIGDEITIDFVSEQGDTFGGPRVRTVGPGIEVDFAGLLLFDVGDLSFDFLQNPNNSVSTFFRLNPDFTRQQITISLTDLDFGATLLDVVVTPGLLDNIGVDFGQDFVSFTYSDRLFTISETSSLFSATFSIDDPAVTPVPLPGTLPLFASGLAVFAFWRRRSATRPT